jgi:hypothetical protein
MKTTVRTITLAFGFLLIGLAMPRVAHAEVFLHEDFEDGILDPRMNIETVGTFNQQPGINENEAFGSARAFGYGRSTCSASCFDGYATTIRIVFQEPAFIQSISFKEMELYGNWGSKGKIFLDDAPYSWGTYNENEDFGRQPTNDGYADTAYRSHTFSINRFLTVIELAVADITTASEIHIDDIIVSGAGFQGHPIPECGRIVLVEDFESCTTGTWIGNCGYWQTWANGDTPSDFIIIDTEHVSGSNALQVAGAGLCWEGAAYRPFTSSRHMLLQGMMKASGSGPIGCHYYQNGFDAYPVLWSFDMPQGDYPGGLSCAVAGGGNFLAVEGFENAAGQWYAVATELDYNTGQAYIWLNGQPLWSTPFDTTIALTRAWLRSGEGYGWFDDISICDVATTTHVGEDSGIIGDQQAETYPIAGIELHQNSPNPFNPMTTISYNLPEAARVSLRIYDVSGRLIRVLVQDRMESYGRHEAIWNGLDDMGRSVAAGVYVYQLKADATIETKHMTMIK